MIILGLPFDNGIRSMLRFGRGIVGAKDGPKAVLDLLEYESEMLLLESFNVDNNIENRRISTEMAHGIVEQKIKTLNKGFIAVGGDHSLTYPLVNGLKEKTSVIVLDAHFDMRPLEEDTISSGNAFFRLLEENIADEMVFFGINKSNNKLFEKQEQYALGKNVKFYYDYEFDIEKIREELNKFDKIYISIDIDVLNEKYAPGVSARNKNGITDEQLFAFIREIARHNIIALDFMETSSRGGDIESLQKTAQIVAKSINLFIKNINPDNKAIL